MKRRDPSRFQLSRRAGNKRLAQQHRTGSFIVVLSSGSKSRFHDDKRAHEWALERLSRMKPGSWAAFYRAWSYEGPPKQGAPWTEPFDAFGVNEHGHVVHIGTRGLPSRDPKRSRRDVVPMPKRDRHVEQAFLLGVLEAMWMDSYISWADEHGHGYTTGHIPQHVRDLSDIPQAPPLAAKKLAKKYVALLVKMNKATVTELWARASRADGREADPRELGFLMAMQSAGHGIGWTDNHKAFSVRRPRAEWGAEGSKGRVRFYGWVSG